MASWRTTALGILMILGALVAVAKPLIDGDPATNPDFGLAFTTIMGGIGLIAAKDHSTP
jgi:hypothetical protein